jgi:hypothetical protein
MVPFKHLADLFVNILCHPAIMILFPIFSLVRKENSAIMENFINIFPVQDARKNKVIIAKSAKVFCKSPLICLFYTTVSLMIGLLS